MALSVLEHKHKHTTLMYIVYRMVAMLLRIQEKTAATFTDAPERDSPLTLITLSKNLGLQPGSRNSLEQLP